MDILRISRAAQGREALVKTASGRILERVVASARIEMTKIASLEKQADTGSNWSSVASSTATLRPKRNVSAFAVAAPPPAQPHVAGPKATQQNLAQTTPDETANLSELALEQTAQNWRNGWAAQQAERNSNNGMAAESGTNGVINKYKGYQDAYGRRIARQNRRTNVGWWDKLMSRTGTTDDWTAKQVRRGNMVDTRGKWQQIKDTVGNWFSGLTGNRPAQDNNYYQVNARGKFNIADGTQYADLQSNETKGDMPANQLTFQRRYDKDGNARITGLDIENDHLQRANSVLNYLKIGGNSEFQAAAQSLIRDMAANPDKRDWSDDPRMQTLIAASTRMNKGMDPTAVNHMLRAEADNAYGYGKTTV